jgi:hypothetical protein
VSAAAAYVTGAAVHNFVTAVASALVEGIPSDWERLFKTRVTVKPATSATISTCDDGSKTACHAPPSGGACSSATRCAGTSHPVDFHHTRDYRHI